MKPIFYFKILLILFIFKNNFAFGMLKFSVTRNVINDSSPDTLHHDVSKRDFEWNIDSLEFGQDYEEFTFEDKESSNKYDLKARYKCFIQYQYKNENAEHR